MTPKQYRQSRTLAILVLIILLAGFSLDAIPSQATTKPTATRNSVRHSIDTVDKKIRTKTNVERYTIFEITAYDLSVASCGKLPTSRGYGITRSGKSLKGKSWKVMAIAVDPKVIKLGTKVKIEFTGWRSKYNGIFTACDSGGAINGNRLDLFLGEKSHKECIKFGRVKAKVTILGGK